MKQKGNCVSNPNNTDTASLPAVPWSATEERTFRAYAKLCAAADDADALLAAYPVLEEHAFHLAVEVGVTKGKDARKRARRDAVRRYRALLGYFADARAARDAALEAVDAAEAELADLTSKLAAQHHEWRRTAAVGKALELAGEEGLRGARAVATAASAVDVQGDGPVKVSRRFAETLLERWCDDGCVARRRDGKAFVYTGGH